MAKLIRKAVNISSFGLLGKDPVKAKKKTPIMPEPDDEAIRLAKKRSVAEQRARAGRASTILSQGSGGGKFGG